MLVLCHAWSNPNGQNEKYGQESHCLPPLNCSDLMNCGDLGEFYTMCASKQAGQSRSDEIYIRNVCNVNKTVLSNNENHRWVKTARDSGRSQ
jgi:hypothetical protein